MSRPIGTNYENAHWNGREWAKTGPAWIGDLKMI